ncbi:MAG TPA: glycosyltransferase family A protein [Xanthomonadaceae bacterium]|jgi:glycosyltransferase involved in cell wall biosynthesis
MSGANPQVSVVVPLYNKAAWVTRCLGSVLRQSWRDFEILVVDDGSTDASVGLVEAFDDPRIGLIRKQNGGAASARNRGMRSASGEYIAFIDADDEWNPDHLQVLLAAMHAYPEAVAACDEYRGEGFSFAGGIGGDVVPIPVASLPEPVRSHGFDYVHQLCAGRFVTSCSSTMVRASLLSECGIEFDETLRRGEDLNFWVRLSRQGDFVYCEFDGARYHRDDATSEMNRRRAGVEPTPDIFRGLSEQEFEPEELVHIRRFLRREYLKQAFQNRGLPFDAKEMVRGALSGNSAVDGLAYRAVRFAPERAMDAAKRARKWLGLGA